MNLSSRSAALLSLAMVSAAAAPAAAQPSGVPSYATREETLHGRIAGIVDTYHIRLDDERGFVDNVTLHDGTVIQPAGLTLAPGQAVTIYGHADGNTFAASQIETPYQESDPGAYSDDGGDAYPAPYALPDPYWYGPYDPYGYFGPSIGIGFGFYGGYGRGGYGHGGYGHGGYGHGGYGHGGYGGYGHAAPAGGHGSRR
jgi:hypothetical protein